MAAVIDLERAATMGIDVAGQRQRAELVLQGILELRQMRGRLANVTVDDVALLLALVERGNVMVPGPATEDDRCSTCRSANRYYGVVDGVDCPNQVFHDGLNAGSAQR